MKTTIIPVWNHRTLIGHASTLKGAELLIRRIMQTRGFNLKVWRRLAIVCETQELPDGFVFALSRGGKE